MSKPIGILGGSVIGLTLLERAGGKRIIHNYGHGGSGITFAWGCAEETAVLAQSV